MAKTKSSTSERKLTIFDISAELLELAQLLLQLEGSPEAQDSAIRAALMKEDSPLDDLLVEHQTVKQKALAKLNSFCGLIRFLENSRDNRKAHANMVRDRAQIDDNHIHRLKKLLLWFMTEHKMNQIETLEYRVSHYELEPRLKLLVAPEELPAQYVQIETTTSYTTLTKEIEKDLKAGVAAAKEIATWYEPTQVLRISKPSKKGSTQTDS